MQTLRFFHSRTQRRLARACIGLTLALAACGADQEAPDAGAVTVAPNPSLADAGVGAAPGAPGLNTPPAAGSDAGSTPPATGTPGSVEAGAGPVTTGDAGSTQGPGAQPDAGSTPAYSWPSDCEKHHTFLAHNNSGTSDTSKKQVAPGAQYYASYYFRAPWGSDEVQGLKFRTILDNRKIVHHWILYGVNSATQQDGAVQGGEGQPIGSMQGEAYIAGWAPGAPDIELPAGVGLHLPTGASAMFRLEIHYFNTAAGSVAELDRSGVEFCVTSKKRAAEAAIHWMGSTNISVRANSKAEVKSTCKPQITNGPVHLLSLSSHMHKTGVHSTAVLKRADGSAPVTLIDDPFSFMEQTGFKQPRDGSAPDVLINAGDTIDVSCSFDNQTNQNKVFGSNTEDEMCFFYAMAWPRGQLRNGALFSIVPGAEPEVNCIQ